MNLALDENGLIFFTPRAILCGDFIGITENEDTIAIARPGEWMTDIVAWADINQSEDTKVYYPIGSADNTARMYIHRSFINVVWSKSPQQGEDENERRDEECKW